MHNKQKRVFAFPGCTKQRVIVHACMHSALLHYENTQR